MDTFMRYQKDINHHIMGYHDLDKNQDIYDLYIFLDIMGYYGILNVDNKEKIGNI